MRDDENAEHADTGDASYTTSPGTGGLISANNSTLHIARSYDEGITREADPGNPIPLHRTLGKELWGVGAQVVGTRTYVWLTDIYDEGGPVGYFDPRRGDGDHAREAPLSRDVRPVPSLRSAA